MTRRTAVSLLSLSVPAALRAADAVEHREVIEKTFPLSGSGAPHLLVDNIHGSIKVTGDQERSIRIRVEKLIKARSADKVEVAQREVRLDMDQQGNEVRLYVDGPFRNQDGVNWRGRDYYGYDVSFSYQINVPRQIALILKTVNGGDIDVRNIDGEFDVRNVNGPIEMRQIAGYGSVRTVNGRVTVEMPAAPAKATSFTTLNGAVEVRLPANLSADLRIKNRFNGAVYTDYEVTPLPPLPATVEQVSGHYRYRTNDFAPFRVGKGGPELSFETFNGTIRILSQAR